MYYLKPSKKSKLDKSTVDAIYNLTEENMTSKEVMKESEVCNMLKKYYKNEFIPLTVDNICELDLGAIYYCISTDFWIPEEDGKIENYIFSMDFNKNLVINVLNDKNEIEYKFTPHREGKKIVTTNGDFPLYVRATREKTEKKINNPIVLTGNQQKSSKLIKSKPKPKNGWFSMF